MSRKLNRVSARITEQKAQGASQAMLHATGLSPEDLGKPQVGIAGPSAPRQVRQPPGYDLRA